MKKKFLQGLLTMGMALAVTVGSSLIEAKAAGISQGNITVDYANQKITVKSSDDAKISAAVTTVKKNASKGDTVKLASPVIRDNDNKDSGVVIDISSLAVTKDNYISIWGNVNTEPVLIKLPGVSIKPRAIVDNENKKITIADISKDKKNTAPAAGNFEYCTSNGTWSDFENGETSFAEYAYLGSNLRFRIKASESKAVGSDVVETLTDKDKNETKVYAAPGNFAGSELKAKISKWANGPKVTIDYLKRTIKFPKPGRNAEAVQYRFVPAGSNQIAAWSSLDAAKLGTALPIDDYTVSNGSLCNGTLDVYIPAKKDDKGNVTKAASLVTEYKIGNIVETVNVKKSADATSGSALKATVADDSNKTLIECTEIAGNGNTVNIKFTNNTTDVYEIVAVAADASDPVVSSAKGAKKILAKGTADTSPKETTIKGVKKGYRIFIHKAGNAKATAFAVPYVEMGTAYAVSGSNP